MKTPKPKLPNNLPPETVQIGGPIEWFSISLRLRGDNLVPEEITAVLCREPSDAWQKDKPLFRADGTFMRVPKFGAWIAELKSEETDEWDCCEATIELMQTLPEDVSVWLMLAKQYRISVSVGLSTDGSGRGFSLTPELMRYLAERCISYDFDIYHDMKNNG